jgi:ABC-2 type transport system permease protein
VNNLLRSEWIKLRTVPLHIILWCIAGGFVFVITVLVGVLTGSPRFFSAADLANLVGGTSIVAGLLVSVVSALAITSEFAHGTIRPTLAATPDRTKVWGAKAILLLVTGVLIGVIVVWASYLVGMVILNMRDGDIGISGDDGSLAVLVGTPFLFGILAMFGYGLGLLLRNSPAAVSIAILWPLLIETVLGGVLSIAGVDDPVRYLPYQSAFALAVAEPDDLVNGRVGGGLFFAVVVAVLVAVAVVINNRRDV